MAATGRRAAALARRQHNSVLQHARHIEPRLQALLDRAGPPPEPGYQPEQRYRILRAASRHLVGPQAENP